LKKTTDQHIGKVKLPGKGFGTVRTWLLAYLVVEYIVFWIYFPLDSFQNITTAIFFALMLTAGLLVKNEHLFWVTILTGVFINPIFSSATFNLGYLNQFLFALVIGEVFFLKRKEQKMLIQVLFFCSIFSFLYQRYQIKTLTKAFQEKVYSTANKNVIEVQIDSSVAAKRNVYVVLLDGYPAFDILKDSFHFESALKPFLSQKGFEFQPPFVKYPRTPLSLLNIFARCEVNAKREEDLPEYIYTDFPFFKDKLDHSPLVTRLHSANYRFDISSSLEVFKTAFPTPQYQPSFYVTYAVFTLRNILTKKEAERKWIFLFSRVGVADYIDKATENLDKNLADKDKKVCVTHYLTFHLPYMYTKQQEANYADSLGINAVNKILATDSSATVIVMSDHGERQELLDYKNKIKGIYAIRRGY
jgi:hypothetical protein